jgi:hypothetical protein
MTDRDFYLERLMERAQELRRQCTDEETYRVELAKLFITNARNEQERKQWESLLATNKFFQRIGQDDERHERIEELRALLKARQPFVRISVVLAGPRSTRHWLVTWSDGPSEDEIKELVAPFARKDLTFRFLRRAAR